MQSATTNGEGIMTVQPYPEFTGHGAPLALRHIVAAVREYADASPDTGEGGAYDRRTEFAWTAEQDLRLLAASDNGQFADYEFTITIADLYVDCLEALTYWTEADR